MLQFIGLQRVGYYLATEQQQSLQVVNSAFVHLKKISFHLFFWKYILLGIEFFLAGFFFFLVRSLRMLPFVALKEKSILIIFFVAVHGLYFFGSF